MLNVSTASSNFLSLSTLVFIVLPKSFSLIISFNISLGGAPGLIIGLPSLGINNTEPIAGTVSLGTPANVILNYQQGLGGNVFVEAIPKKTRQGQGKHTKYAATSRNKAKKRSRGQGK